MKGHHCNIDEISTVALKTMEIDQKLQGKAVHVRVTQGREPPNFMKIFGNRITIYQGNINLTYKGNIIYHNCIFIY